MTINLQTVEVPDARSSRWGECVRILPRSLLAHDIFIALTCMYGLSAIAVEYYVDGLVSQDFAALSFSFVVYTLPVLFIAMLTLRFFHIAFNVRSRTPTVDLYRDMKDVLSNPHRIANGIPMVIALFLFFKIFSWYKTNIPLLVPFKWDLDFASIERSLHFGRQPWEWLQPLIGYGPITFALNVFYNLWFMTLWVMWIGFAMLPKQTELRTQFFLSFISIWSIGGSLTAIGLSSAGPCYFGLLGYTPDPFADLMVYLNDVNQTFPLWALRAQDLLWSGYLGQQDVIAGITAMPSMHNATTLLFALAGWRISRTIGIVLTAYAVIIFIGSIHLGWHYAIDAYVAYAITLVFWFLCAPIARWHMLRPAVKAHNRLVDTGGFEGIAPSSAIAMNRV